MKTNLPNNPFDGAMHPSNRIYPLPDGDFLSEIAKQTPAVLGFCLEEIIRVNPQTLLASPLLAQFMTRKDLRGFSVDSVEVNVNGFTVGHAEIHSLMRFELREKSSATRREGRGIRGWATVVLMKDGTVVFDAAAAETLSGGTSNN